MWKRGLEFRSYTHLKGRVWLCVRTALEDEISMSPGETDQQPSWAGELQVQWETSSQLVRWRLIEEEPISVSNLHTNVCTCARALTHTHTHTLWRHRKHSHTHKEMFVWHEIKKNGNNRNKEGDKEKYQEEWIWAKKSNIHILYLFTSEELSPLLDCKPHGSGN